MEFHFPVSSKLLMVSIVNNPSPSHDICVDLTGVASHEGRVLIMTTNYLEKLDGALIRHGRPPDCIW